MSKKGFKKGGGCKHEVFAMWLFVEKVLNIKKKV